MIIGLTAAGIPENDAVAAVFVQRLFTAYLPPIWGWFVPGVDAQEGVPVSRPVRAGHPVEGPGRRAGERPQAAPAGRAVPR